jgi:hypothetical protein
MFRKEMFFGAGKKPFDLFDFKKFFLKKLPLAV